jgi:hypothetical protein
MPDLIGELESRSDLSRLYAALGDAGEANRVINEVKEQVAVHGLLAL